MAYHMHNELAVLENKEQLLDVFGADDATTATHADAAGATPAASATEFSTTAIANDTAATPEDETTTHADAAQQNGNPGLAWESQAERCVRPHRELF